MRKNVYERSTNYRRNFLNYYHGVFNSGIYHCSYCGKLIKPENMTVDHLIPVNKVKHFGIARILMKIQRIHNINDVKNLIPSCYKCNSKKSDKMGIWIIKGEIGRHFGYWLFHWSFWLAALLVLIYEYHPQIISFLSGSVARCLTYFS